MIKYTHNVKKKCVYFFKKKKAFKYLYSYILDVENEGWEV